VSAISALDLMTDSHKGRKLVSSWTNHRGPIVQSHPRRHKYHLV